MLSEKEGKAVVKTFDKNDDGTQLEYNADTNQVKNRKTNKCLNAGASGLEFVACGTADSQQFYPIYLYQTGDTIWHRLQN